MSLRAGEFWTPIPETKVEGKRLGRHFHFDPRNLDFRAIKLVGGSVDLPITNVVHQRLVPAFDQGNLGSCTGNALAGTLMTVPENKPNVVYTEETAKGLYSLATQIDPSGGIYPPDDPGSTGPDVCKAAMKDGYCRSYMHVFGLDEVLTVLRHFPLIIGSNWYDSMDDTDSNGVVSISPNAQIRGGHEYEVSEVYPAHKLVGCWNSWGPDWGKRGQMYISYADLDRLLGEQGDATLPVV